MVIDNLYGFPSMRIIPERQMTGPDQWRGKSSYRWSALDHTLRNVECVRGGEWMWSVWVWGGEWMWSVWV